jgi:hypothetical protein
MDAMATEIPIKKLILVPALITLAVTLLRLTGELMHWSPRLFNPAAGGGGAIIGIAWLVPFFGVYFALKLAGLGERPPSTGAAIGFPLLGGLLVPVLGFVVTKLGMSQQSFVTFGLFIVASLVGALIAYRGWPGLGKTLLAYGLAARIPVAIVMLIAMLGDWGTHYDVAPPDFPAMSPLAKWLLIGLLPQMTIWIWYTMCLGAFFGALILALTGRARRPATA